MISDDVPIGCLQFFVGLIDVIKTHDIGMVDQFHDSNLPFELLLKDATIRILVLFQALLRDNFDGDLFDCFHMRPQLNSALQTD